MYTSFIKISFWYCRMYYTFFTLIKWNNFCPILYLKVQRWLESTNSPLHLFVCFSCGYQWVQGRQDYDFSSQFGLVKSHRSVHCDQRGQVNSSVHNLIKNVLIHLFYCHIIMNPEGICIDSFPLVNKNGIFYIPEHKNLKCKYNVQERTLHTSTN